MQPLWGLCCDLPAICKQQAVEMHAMHAFPIWLAMGALPRIAAISCTMSMEGLMLAHGVTCSSSSSSSSNNSRNRIASASCCVEADELQCRAKAFHSACMGWHAAQQPERHTQCAVRGWPELAAVCPSQGHVIEGAQQAEQVVALCPWHAGRSVAFVISCCMLPSMRTTSHLLPRQLLTSRVPQRMMSTCSCAALRAVRWPCTALPAGVLWRRG